MEMDDSRALALVAAHNTSRDQAAASSSTYGSYPLALAGSHPTGTSSHAYATQAAHPSTASTSSQPNANNMVALSGGIAGPLALGQQSTSSSAGSTALKNIPAFLNKLYSMVNDPATNELIRWTDAGNSFIVPNSDKVARELLPRFFKHSNFGSFVRQLNMYGFHKVPHLQQGVLKVDGDGEKEKAETLEFRNENFQRDQPDLMYLIQRKKGAAGAMPTGSHQSGMAGLEGLGIDGQHDGLSIANEPFSAGNAQAPSSLGAPNPAALSKFQHEVAAILSEVTAIKRHQAILSTELRDLQSNNAQLWQHSMENRQRHEKNGDLIDKILKFLAGVYGGRALSEGAGFSSSSIDSAIKGNSRPSTPGLHAGHNGMGSNAQHAQGANNKQHHHQPYRQQQHHPQASTSKSSGMELVPSTSRKRQRLLIEASPAKERFQSAASTATSVSNDDESAAIGSYFEEIPSDGENDGRVDGSTRPPRRSTSNESLNRQGAIERLSASPANQASSRFESLPASDDPFHAIQSNPQQQPAPSNPEQGKEVSDRQLSLPLPSPSYYQQLLDSASNGTFDFNDPNFLSSIGLGDTNALPAIVNENGSAAPLTSLPPTPLTTTTQDTAAPPSSDLALSPYRMSPAPTPSFPITNPAPNGQALTKYNNTLQNATEENERLKTRMDSLSEAIDKLVSQLPQGFDFSSLGLGNAEPGNAASDGRSQNGQNGYSASNGGLDDEFDFSQYLDNADDYSGINVDQQLGEQTEEQRRLNDSLAKYLDPELADISNDAEPHQAASTGSQDTVKPSHPSPVPQSPEVGSVKEEGQAMSPVLPAEEAIVPPTATQASEVATESASLAHAQPSDGSAAVDTSPVTPASTKTTKKRKSSVPADSLQTQGQQPTTGRKTRGRSKAGDDGSMSPQPKSEGENASGRPTRRSSRVPKTKR